MVWGKSLEPFLISSTISPALTRQLSLQLAGLTYDKRSPEVPLCCTGNNIFKRKGLSCCSSCSPLVMLRCSTAPTFLCGIPLRCVLCHFFCCLAAGRLGLRISTNLQYFSICYLMCKGWNYLFGHGLFQIQSKIFKNWIRVNSKTVCLAHAWFSCSFLYPPINLVMMGSEWPLHFSKPNLHLGQKP